MKYDLSTKEKIINEYNNGKDSRELSEEYGIKQGTITYWLRKEGLTRHRGPKSKIGKEDYFDKIDTDKKAYYLGFIMADGNVSIYNGQYSLKIGISSVDKEVIDGFLEEIDSKNKPYFTQSKEIVDWRTGVEYISHEKYSISLTSRHMVESLMRLGIVPRKTGIESIPEIEERLIPSFLRGFFDGDGITDIVQRRAGFVSCKEMLEQIQEEIGTAYTIHKTNGAYYFLSGIEFSRWLYHYLYSDATAYLTRKRERLWSIL